jgi:hypothetical protein
MIFFKTFVECMLCKCVLYYRCDSHATKDFTRFHWIIQDHVIHELYCHEYKKISSVIPQINRKNDESFTKSGLTKKNLKEIQVQK